MNEKLSIEAFVFRAIEKLARPGCKGIHAVYSGFNSAFRDYFPGSDPRSEVAKLVADKKVEVRPVKGGVMIYRAGEGPVSNPSGEEALKKMGVNKA